MSMHLSIYLPETYLILLTTVNLKFYLILKSYTWRQKNSTETVDLDSSSQNLTINSADGEGLYTCLATNECGTALQEFQVIIPRKLRQIIV